MNLMRNAVVFILVLISQIISRLVCGSIPVNGGAGWDGNAYLNLIKLLAEGGAVDNDPYRTIRLPGMAFGLGFGYLGYSDETILVGQSLFNMTLMALGAVLLYSSILKMGGKFQSAVISVSLYALAWPVLVIPSYYPLLTDHAAIFFGCLALWCWAYHKDVFLWLLIPTGFWVMPGVFLIPLVLIAFRSSGTLNLDSSKSVSRNILWGKLIVAGLVIFFLGRLGLHFLNAIPSQLIADHSRAAQGVTALLEIRRLSTAVVIIQFAFLVWIIVDRLIYGEIWHALRRRQAAAGLFAAALGAYIISTIIDWSTGFKGPPLINFMSYQSLALPAKPMIAHFLGLTPALLLVVWKLLHRSNIPAQIGLSAAVIAFLPFMLFGSESRQWVVALPVITALFALQPWSFAQRLITLATAILIALPMFSLKNHVDTALATGVGFQHYDWQYYFSRQGPWMSVDSYETALSLIIIYTLLVAALGVRRAESAPPAAALTNFMKPDKRDLH